MTLSINRFKMGQGFTECRPTHRLRAKETNLCGEWRDRFES